MGYSQLLEIDQTLATEKKEYSQQIIQAGNHLLALIDQVLDFSMIEAGELKFKIVEVNLKELLQECERLMQSMAVKHGFANKLICFVIFGKQYAHFLAKHYKKRP
jgi:signal transduction histidine kinase